MINVLKDLRKLELTLKTYQWKLLRQTFLVQLYQNVLGHSMYEIYKHFDKKIIFSGMFTLVEKELTFFLSIVPLD